MKKIVLLFCRHERPSQAIESLLKQCQTTCPVSAIVFQKEVCSEELQVQNTYQQKFRVPILILFILSTKIIIIFSFSFIRKIKYFDSAGYMSYREMITKFKNSRNSENHSYYNRVNILTFFIIWQEKNSFLIYNYYLIFSSGFHTIFFVKPLFSIFL